MFGRGLLLWVLLFQVLFNVLNYFRHGLHEISMNHDVHQSKNHQDSERSDEIRCLSCGYSQNKAGDCWPYPD